MSGADKPKPSDISTESANNASRENNFHTVSPVSPLFAEDNLDPVAGTSQTTDVANSQTTAPIQASVHPPDEETPPPRPPRPLTPQRQVEMTLAEAFPTVEPSVIKAVLIASRGDIEPAFNALLAMTDPSYVPEEPAPSAPPAPVPRPSRSTSSRAYAPRVDSRHPPPRQSDYNPAHVYQDRVDMARLPQQQQIRQPRNQLEADELYARQLAEQYNNAGRSRGRGGVQNTQTQQPRHRRNDSDEDYTGEDKEHSFLDDDLPVIKENIRQGFLQTQTKVNQWVAEFKKKLDGEPTSPEIPPNFQDPRVGSRSTSRGGPSGYSGYDADPRVLGDDFAHLDLRDSTRDENPPRRPPRPVANPNLFQSTPTAGNSGGSRKVSFQEVRDDDLYTSPPARVASPATNTAAATAPGLAKSPSPTAAGKWQPLKSVAPTPIDGDPFGLGDSDDERDHGLVPETKPDATKGGVSGPQESGTIQKSEPPK